MHNVEEWKEQEEARTKIAHTYAVEALRRAPVQSVELLWQVANIGNPLLFDGHRFNTCFYGILACGAGLRYEGLTNDEVTELVIGFAKRRLDVTLERFRPNPLERFCMNMNSRKFALVRVWCEEDLKRRRRNALRRSAPLATATL